MNESTRAVPVHGPGTTTETRIPEVSNEMDQLVSICDVLDKQVSSLEVRLSPVLAQRKEGGENTANAPEPVRVPLAQTIHDRHRHLVALSDQLHSITNRIEV